MMRRLDAGVVVAALGALLLLVSLFLDWYGRDDREGVSGWTVFEAIDLLLAAVALLALSTVLSRAGIERRLPEVSLLLLGSIALAVVFSQIVHDPPRLAGLGPELKVGAWLALAGAALLTAGAVMSIARVSLALSVEHRAPRPGTPPPEPETVKLTDPERPA